MATDDEMREELEGQPDLTDEAPPADTADSQADLEEQTEWRDGEESDSAETVQVARGRWQKLRKQVESKENMIRQLKGELRQMRGGLSYTEYQRQMQTQQQQPPPDTVYQDPAEYWAWQQVQKWRGEYPEHCKGQTDEALMAQARQMDGYQSRAAMQMVGARIQALEQMLFNTQFHIEMGQINDPTFDLQNPEIWEVVQPMLERGSTLTQAYKLWNKARQGAAKVAERQSAPERGSPSRGGGKSRLTPKDAAAEENERVSAKFGIPADKLKAVDAARKTTEKERARLERSL